jgi:hypothetical protein
MQFWSKLPAMWVFMLASTLIACGGPDRPDFQTDFGADAPEALVVAEFDRMPSGVAQNSLGQTFVAFPAWVERGPSLLRDDGDYVFEPWLNDGVGATFRSVNGLHMDSQDRLWVVDNGRIDLAPPSQSPEVVVLDSLTGEELFRRSFDASLAPLPGAFLNDVAVFEEQGIAVFTESGLGSESALIVWDYVADVALRSLASHRSLQADPAHPVTVGGEAVQIGAKPNTRPWLVGANGITSYGDTVVFGATSSADLWCVNIADLRNPSFDEPERCGDRPLFDGIASVSPEQARSLVDELESSSLAFGVIATDLDRGWLSLIDPSTGVSHPIPLPGSGVPIGSEMGIMRLPRGVNGPRAILWPLNGLTLGTSLGFPVALEPTADGLLVTEGQFHLMPLLHDGADRRSPPYRLWFLPW